MACRHRTERPVRLTRNADWQFQCSTRRDSCLHEYDEYRSKILLHYIGQDIFIIDCMDKNMRLGQLEVIVIIGVSGCGGVRRSARSVAATATAAAWLGGGRTVGRVEARSRSTTDGSFTVYYFNGVEYLLTHRYFNWYYGNPKFRRITMIRYWFVLF